MADPTPPGEIARCFARVFAGGDGARALAHLRSLTLDRALGPNAGADALRHIEGQRGLVLLIQALIARGRAPADPSEGD